MVRRAFISVILLYCSTTRSCWSLIILKDDSPASDTDNSPWTDKNVLSSILTSEGGVVDGEGVRLVYPPGAVDSPVNVNVTFEDPSKYEGFLFRKDLENDVMFGAPIINLQPNGYLFKKPVTLTTKFAVQDVKFSDVLVLHGTDANDGKITWEDVTKNAIIYENVQDVTIEIEHFSRIVVLLLKYTCTRSEDICPRFNSLAFHYDLLVFKKSCTSSEEVEREVEEELALLFVSQDVRHEQFDKEQGTSALGQLEKERFVKLHVQRCTDAQPIRRIYDSEFLQVEIYIGEDYEVEKSAEFNVQSSIWWNTGEIVRLALKPNQDVRSLCGTITVQGKLGHISTWHFSEEGEFFKNDVYVLCSTSDSKKHPSRPTGVERMTFWCLFRASVVQKVDSAIHGINFYYINFNEIPSELSRENLISSHVKIACYLHM